jgi:phage shock protein PspC (stress-responsive transcriptional regulator)
MKKTISIHIKGINFLIEENAYELLKDYLKRLEDKLSSVNGKEEILEDIELRVVELFTNRLSNRKEVIEELDVRQTIETLGEPEQFLEDESTNESNSNQKNENDNQENTSYQSSEKRLYRNIENASIAGVCSGLAQYFKMDVIIVRILFVLFTLAAGFGVPLYIILWVVLPSAHTHIDRLRMQGRPITVENVREEVEMAAKRMSRNSQNFASKIHRESVLQKSFRTVGQIISKGFGGFLLFLGVAASIAFVIIVIGQLGSTPVKTADGYLGLYNFGLLFFEDPEQLNWLWVSAGVISIVGIIWLIATGTRLLFNLRFPWYKYLSRSVFLFAIIGVVLVFYFGSMVAREYTIEKSIETDTMVSTESLTIQTKDDDYNVNNYRHNGYNRRNGRNYWLLITKKGIEERGVRIYYEESPDSLYHIIEERIASSRNDRDALRRAKNIQFKITQNGSTYSIPNTFHFPEADKIRNQRVHVYIQVPKGKSVKVNDEFKYPTSDEDVWEEEPVSESVTISL